MSDQAESLAIFRQNLKRSQEVQFVTGDFSTRKIYKGHILSESSEQVTISYMKDTGFSDLFFTERKYVYPLGWEIKQFK